MPFLRRGCAQCSVQHASAPPGQHVATCLQGQWGSSKPRLSHSALSFCLRGIWTWRFSHNLTDGSFTHWLLSQAYTPNVWICFIIVLLPAAFIVLKLTEGQIQWAWIDPLTSMRAQTLTEDLGGKGGWFERLGHTLVAGNGAPSASSLWKPSTLLSLKAVGWFKQQTEVSLSPKGQTQRKPGGEVSWLPLVTTLFR